MVFSGIHYSKLKQVSFLTPVALQKKMQSVVRVYFFERLKLCFFLVKKGFLINLSPIRFLITNRKTCQYWNYNVCMTDLEDFQYFKSRKNFNNIIRTSCCKHFKRSRNKYEKTWISKSEMYNYQWCRLEA